jgi:hypothetical protein
MILGPEKRDMVNVDFLQLIDIAKNVAELFLKGGGFGRFKVQAGQVGHIGNINAIGSRHGRIVQGCSGTNKLFPTGEREKRERGFAFLPLADDGRNLKQRT